MGGGVSSLPAEVSLAEAKELAGAKWQPAWEEKFAEAKISRDEAVKCYFHTQLLGCRSVVRLPPMLPLVALASGEALRTRWRGAGCRGTLSLCCSAQEMLGLPCCKACGRATDASDGLPEDTSADESIRQVS